MRNGFTLIELLVVVMIVGVLTSIAVPQYRKSLDRAKAAEAMQLLPAIFEARERWMIENQLHWDNGVAKNAAGNTVPVTFAKLDIETKGTSPNGYPGILQTKNFHYHLVGGTGAFAYATNQPDVYASPNWGGSRDLDAVVIRFGGDKFCCSDRSEGDGCERLNFTEICPGGED
ncbi:MAG: prepilin-type N-terminal cleavage/methylation domain-containing protein [Elusimicrobiaceae bacterium]|nr:prepilin-type N-terminal cleavage/methylation domain-containing protein [Elusimicrobiaceae bacterium]